LKREVEGGMRLKEGGRGRDGDWRLEGWGVGIKKEWL